MTVIARFEVIPVRDGSMSTAIASALRALDGHPVSYQTTATDTIIEAETVDQVFAAVQAAHQAIPEDRVITSVEIDEDRRRPQDMSERVASVERALGHPPRRHQPTSQQPAGQQPAIQQPAAQQPTAQQPTPQAPAAQQSPVQQPTTQQATSQQPAARSPQSGQPTRSTTTQSTTTEPTITQPTTTQPREQPIPPGQ